MIIDCISDLHGHYPELQGGDLLIVAGDLTANDSHRDLYKFFAWVTDQVLIYKRIIIIAGNHDNEFERVLGYFFPNDGMIAYLCDSGTEYTYEYDDVELEMCGIHASQERTIKIWGSPWTKTFEGMNPKCKAFAVDTEEELAEKWALIPDDVDILVTHSPAFGVLDRNSLGYHCGSIGLATKILKINPKLHVFGHIHESYGNRGLDISEKRRSIFIEICPTKSINASYVNEHYEPVNKPIRVEL
jgi:Icc-related predicted phosphoesterase